MKNHLLENIDFIEHDYRIEESLVEDIDSAIKYDCLYNKDFLKIDGQILEIFTPVLNYPFALIKNYLEDVNYIRFLFSIFSQIESLKMINKLIIKPIHIETNNIELTSLYLPDKKYLIHYLHYPYLINSSLTPDNFFENTISSFDMINNNIINGNTTEQNNNQTVRCIKIPMLLDNIISLNGINSSRMEKFLVKIDNGADQNILHLLDEISYFYSTNGY